MSCDKVLFGFPPCDIKNFAIN